MRKVDVCLILIVCFVAAPIAANEGQSYAHIRKAEGVCYAHLPELEEPIMPTVNFPVYPETFLTTDENSFVALKLSNGSDAFLGENSILGVHSLGTRDTLKLGEFILDAGSVVFNMRPAKGDIFIFSGEGTITLMREGAYRIDVFSVDDDRRTVRVSVYSGTAKVSSGADVKYVDAGYRTYFEPFGNVQTPSVFREGDDALIRWAKSSGLQTTPYTYALSTNYGLVGDVAYYSDTLTNHGAWRYYPVYGVYVWVPHTPAPGWRPYWNGYWHITPAGMFWVSHEPWGWVTSRYGRWMWTMDFGWVWMAGRGFSPAWVSWTYYGGYVGWCPLGFYGHPATSYWGYPYHGYYYSGWTFVPHGWFFHINLPSISFTYISVKNYVPADAPTCDASEVAKIVPPKRTPPDNRPPMPSPKPFPHPGEISKEKFPPIDRDFRPEQNPYFGKDRDKPSTLPERKPVKRPEGGIDKDAIKERMEFHKLKLEKPNPQTNFEKIRREYAAPSRTNVSPSENQRRAITQERIEHIRQFSAVTSRRGGNNFISPAPQPAPVNRAPMPKNIQIKSPSPAVAPSASFGGKSAPTPTPDLKPSPAPQRTEQIKDNAQISPAKRKAK